MRFLQLIIIITSLALCQSQSFQVGGYVPEIQNCRVNLDHVDLSKPGNLIKIAEIEIHNNLPSYSLVVSILGLNVTDVRITGIGGTLGRDITAPVNHKLVSDGTGRFVWSPGPQKTATVNYKLALFVSYSEVPVETVRINAIGQREI